MEHLYILALILIALILFASEKFRPDVVAIIVMMTLIVTQTVTIEEGFSGFSNPAVITVIAMFILSAGLVRTGVADAIGHMMIKVAGPNPILLTIIVMLTVGLMSAFMNNIGATAILITSIYAISKKVHYPASKLLIPLSFGSLMGGLTTLIGTPPNLLVSTALSDYGYEPFQMFDFLPTGLAIMAVGALYMAFVGRYLIPVRGDHPNYTSIYHLNEFITEISITENSSLSGVSVQDSFLQKDFGLTILRIRRDGTGQVHQFIPEPKTVLQANDRLIVEGNLEKLLRIKESKDLMIHIETKISDQNLIGENVELAEVAIAPNSALLNKTIKSADIRKRFGVLAIALRRRGHYIHQDYVKEPLDVGDVMLVQGTPEALKRISQSEDFLVINLLEEKPRTYSKAPFAIASIGLAVLLAVTDLLHISAAGMLGVILMVLTGCVKPEDMYKQVEWRVIFLIAGMMPLGIAMDDTHTGTAMWLASGVVSLVGGYGPYVVLASIFILTTMITEVMSNAAAAVLLAPIGISIAIGMNLMPHPFLMAIAIGASTTFLTPIGHQANVLVYGVGGYRFSDFPKVGVILNILIFIVTMVLVPMVWPFTAIK
jgi:di/tricarboxylate transporter